MRTEDTCSGSGPSPPYAIPEEGRGLEATWVIVPLRLGGLYDLHWTKAVSVVQSRVLALWASFSLSSDLSW